MANEVLIKHGTAIVIADTTDYAGDLGTRTDQIDLTSLASGGARQSTKVDLEYLATDKFPRAWAVYAAIEFAVAPTSGNVVDFYVGFSPSATAGTANPGGLSGADSAYTGTSGDSLDDSLKQLVYIGSLIATADATTTVQFQSIGIITPLEQYASFVVDNNADQALVADAVEMAIRIVPLVDEVQ
jgi:hypothetical protein